MTNLRDLRLRMRAIGQTLQVTKAMNLISTAKLRRCRRILSDTEPYFTRIQKAMYDILSGASLGKSRFLSVAAEVSHTAIVVISSDKGLAGGYNANVFRHVKELAEKVKNPLLILIGAVGYRHFIHSPLAILENFSYKSRLPTMDDAQEVTEYLISQYLWGMFDEAHIVYTHMYSSIKLQPRELKILPLCEANMREEFGQKLGKESGFQFEYYPSRRRVFDSFVPMYIRGVLYGALIEAYASEHSARMTAMDEASKNAQEMLGDLQLSYNRTRQASITQEMSEIVGGAEAL
ncbi:MAG: ATP synthase F1 subunit gamma [Treponema sp.]|nr:ATP synthase F1 subunit gamma [Treponema sp.]